MINVSSDVLLSERTGYALLECNGLCGSFLLIHSKDFEFSSKYLCSLCVSK